MTTQSRGDLIAAMNVLVKRRANTADAQEQATLDEALDKLAGWVQDLNQAAMLDAARIVALASDELEKVVASARVGPFDNFLSDIHNVMARLRSTQGQMQPSKSLPSEPLAAGTKAKPAAPQPPVAPVAPVAAVPAKRRR